MAKNMSQAVRFPTSSREAGREVGLHFNRVEDALANQWGMAAEK